MGTRILSEIVLLPLQASAPRRPDGPAQSCAVALGGRPALHPLAARTAASDHDPVAAGRASVPDGRGPGPAFRQVRSGPGLTA